MNRETDCMVSSRKHSVEIFLQREDRNICKQRAESPLKACPGVGGGLRSTRIYAINQVVLTSEIGLGHEVGGQA